MHSCHVVTTCDMHAWSVAMWCVPPSPPQRIIWGTWTPSAVPHVPTYVFQGLKICVLHGYKDVLFIEVSLFQGVLIRGVPPYSITLYLGFLKRRHTFAAPNTMFSILGGTSIKLSRFPHVCTCTYAYIHLIISYIPLLLRCHVKAIKCFRNCVC